MLRLTMIIFLLSALIGSANAQAEELPQKPNDIEDTLRRKMKDELKFTGMQIDSVCSIERYIRTKNKELKNDHSSSEDDMNIQIKSLIGERRLKLKTILTDYQISQLDALLESIKEMLSEEHGNN